MVCIHSLQQGLRTVVGVSLCLLLASASPFPGRYWVTVTPLRSLHIPRSLRLVHFLRSALADSADSDSPVNTDLNLPGLESLQARKRGFGIAGLDNVDMITSTLDRSRSMSRSRSHHGPRMSSGLTLNQLRDLMKIAG